jgi:hypothetical protein
VEQSAKHDSQLARLSPTGPGRKADNSELDSMDIGSAVAERVQEKASANQKELGRTKVSAWLALAAVAVYFLVPAVRPITLAAKLIIVLLLIALSLSNRLR